MSLLLYVLFCVCFVSVHLFVLVTQRVVKQMLNMIEPNYWQVLRRGVLLNSWWWWGWGIEGKG